VILSLNHGPLSANTRDAVADSGLDIDETTASPYLCPAVVEAFAGSMLNVSPVNIISSQV
jgi:hypothetical protein